MRSRTQLRKDDWKNRQKRTAEEGHRYLGGNRTGIESAAAHAGEQGHRLQDLPSDAVGYGVGGNLIEVMAQRGDCVDADDTGDDLNGPASLNPLRRRAAPSERFMRPPVVRLCGW